MNAFDYVEPATVDEALAWLADRPEATRLLAGGTDLLVRLKRREWTAGRVVNLKRIVGLRGVRRDNGAVVIGALTTIADLERDATIGEFHPVLREAALMMASPQVRALATVGGNLCNASPAADLAPPLIALGAEAEIAGRSGRRTQPIAGFFQGPGRCALASDEMLTGVRVPASTSRGAYLKFSPRRAMDLAVVGVAAARLDGTLRVAVGACAPTPLLVPPDPESAVAACAPIDDLRATADYRRAMVRVLVRRALDRVPA